MNPVGNTGFHADATLGGRDFQQGSVYDSEPQGVFGVDVDVSFRFLFPQCGNLAKLGVGITVAAFSANTDEGEFSVATGLS